MNKHSTINDVAKLANVSKATVSKYLNNTPYVSDLTRDQIEKAIQKLDYHPNSIARGLVNKSINLIALVISNFELLNNYRLVSIIENEAAKFGYDIVLVTTKDDRNIEQDLNKILSERFRHVDGLILANIRQDSADFENLVNSFEHIVMVHRYIPNDFVDYVTIDNYWGGKLVAEHLINLGHKQFAVISGSTKIMPYKERQKGFIDTLIRNDFTSSNFVVIEGNQTLEAGYNATTTLMKRKTPPTSIFATSDLLAFGVLDASKDNGDYVPEKVSLIGYDNIFFSRLAKVPLTTIDGRFEELGTKAVQILVNKIKNIHKDKSLQQIRLEPSLIIRESCIRLNTNDLN